MFVVASGQTGDFRSVAIKSKTGYLWVNNEEGNWYTLEIPGESVTQFAPRKAFMVDGLLLQIVTTRLDRFLPANALQPPGDRAILEAHRDWEAKASEESYKTKLAIESSWHKLTNDKEALLWKFNVSDKPDSVVKKELYLTAVKGDRVLMLGGVVNIDNSETAVTNLLLKSMASLKVSDKPIELNQLKEAIRQK